MWLLLLAAVCFLAATVNWTETDWAYGDQHYVRRHKAFGWLMVIIGLILIITRLVQVS